YIRVDKKDQHQAIAMDSSIYKPFCDWAVAHQCHILFGSNPVQVEQGVENATVWVKPNGEIEKPYTKIHLFDVDVEGQKPVRESDDFVAGSQPRIITIEGWRFGLSICYDLRFPELFLGYSKQGVDLLAMPAAFLQPTGEAHWEVLQRARAIECQAYVVAAAQSGEHQAHAGTAVRRSYGHSLVVDPWGKCLADLGLEVSSKQMVLKADQLNRVRSQIPMANHRKL
ncbi:MAG: carbon-nitrogen hydrolase family protein, partial [Bdellovibrionales bacterium]|nr:carbon-nitrogen hydrolase family protein [Bdellovibrionales bacterium]